jgi:hypothetical protein
MRIYYLALFIIITVTGLAQTEKPEGSKWKYAGTASGGLILGAQEPSYMMQTVQGIKKGRWMLGIGAGLDDYMVRTIPIVAHGEYHLKSAAKANPFVYAQVGPAIASPDGEWNAKIGDVNVFEFETGWLAESGFGYRFPLGKNVKGFTSFGYSFKQARYNEVQSWWIGPPIWPPPQIDENRIQQKMNMFRANIRFGLEW